MKVRREMRRNICAVGANPPGCCSSVKGVMSASAEEEQPLNEK